MKKKVLIIGNSAKEYALAKKLSETCEIFVAPGNDGITEFGTCVDIRENSAQEIIEFALENGIDLIIPISTTSLQSDIVRLSETNNIQIFAPDLECSQNLFDRFLSKKILYKLGIPTPKFGIFEKQSIATDYIKNIKGPFVIKNDSEASAVIFSSPQSSKVILDSMFSEKYSKVLVEEYIYGTPFTFYAITDGYNALPIGSSIIYRYSLEGEGGQLTSGMGACSPNYKLSLDNEAYLMNGVIYPTLDYIEKNKNRTYRGILGVNGILGEDGRIMVLGYQSFMQDSDCAGILAIIDTDIYQLFESCVIGSFSDEIDYIEQKNISATSLVLHCTHANNTENVIHNLNELDDETLVSFTNNVHKNKYLEYEANHGSVMVLTSLGCTPASSSERVYNEAKEIKFDGLKYRKDICKIPSSVALI